ncbi:MAG: type II secretion system protein GspK [Planctomycetota bacterium]|nr:type II secretion system protein GspK [Planctomycetota bacterium]
MQVNQNNADIRRNRPGIVLLVTMVLLVVLSILGYTLTTRIWAQKHRDQYIIDYTKARYACDSAVKYAFTTLGDINALPLVIRNNEPDFSDLFSFNDTEYKEYIEKWFSENAAEKNKTSENFSGDVNDTNSPLDTNDFNSERDVNYAGDTNNTLGIFDFNESNSLVVRGPYGPQWPLITAPAEFEIGSVKVKVEIEDENAKYPIGWAMLDDPNLVREAAAGFKTFCEWMKVNSTDVELLDKEFKEISKIKPFKTDFQPINITEEITKKPDPNAVTPSRTSRRRRPATQAPAKQTIEKTIPASVHIKDFAKLFHSSLIDIDVLAKPTVISQTRKESTLKYMGMWASSKININTAPRQVLEAAFTFGGDASQIAEEIIRQRKIKPFESIESLRKALFRYSDSIKKCENYITTSSNFFTIRVTATSGVAQVSAVIAIIKTGKTMEPIALISG